ncbi:MAG TPA: trypsin-like peptidase domain-containing protein [Ktedonobacteraceae bacterium]|nr:trypsin-like peptidase domain-containing protein [Ktedonobacteraceae bacterium]
MIHFQDDDDKGTPSPYAYWNEGDAAYYPSTSSYTSSAWPQSQVTPQPLQQDEQPTDPQLPVVPIEAQPPSPPKGKRGALRTGILAAMMLLIVLIFGTGLFAGWQFSRASSTTGGGASATVAQTAATSTVQTAQEAVIAKVKPAVVQINVTTASGSAIGSGVIIDTRGYIVTNNHVVANAQSIEVVLNDGTHLTAQLVGSDSADDLAVLKITTTKQLTAISLGDSTKLQVGQDVLAIGNPLGITDTVTSGIISALNRTVSEGQGAATISNAIQTDAPINPGNSGGALIDLQGNLIGIPTLGAIDTEFNTPANGVGFAIPSNLVAKVSQEIIATGNV